MKGKTVARLAYGLLVLCLTFTLGYLLGNGRGQTQVSIQTMTAEAPEPSAPEPETATEDAAVEWPLNINTATQLQLEQLPGVGPELAKRILEYRKENGSFVSKEQLKDVEGIGEKRYAAIEQLITIGGRHESTGSGR